MLEALGIRLDLPPDRVAALADEAGITFCFAAAFHPAMRHAAVPRRELGVGTTFNFLGPLANPARPAAQAIGCADRRMAPVMAGVFAARGVDAWVFRGDDGLDELTTTTTSSVWTVHDGTVTEVTVDPTGYGLAAGRRPRRCVAADTAYNAEVVRRMLDGEEGAVRDAVLLNAGGRAGGLRRTGCAASTRRSPPASRRPATRSTRVPPGRPWTAGSRRPRLLEVQHVRRSLRAGSRAAAGRSRATTIPGRA